jgi:hypothetical protein
MHDRNEIFRKNLQCFPDYIRRLLQTIDLAEVWKRIEIVYTTEGDPICKYKENGSLVHINSKDPWEQAKHWVKRLPFEQLGTIFVYGCGFGYPLFELFKKLHANTIILIFEQNPYIFVAMLHFFDFEPMIRTFPRCVFYVGCFEDFSREFSTLLSTSGVFYLTDPSVLFTPGTRIFRKEYLELQRYIFERLSQQISLLGNDHSDSLIGFHNMTANVGEVLDNPYIGSLKDKFNNVPAFIVANGPSLDANIHELKRVKGKGLIFCCESAIVPLMKNDIKPDAIFVLERNPESYLYHFQDKYPKDIALLALSVVDPRIFATFAGPKIPIFRSSESTAKWLNQFVGDGSALFGGSNVAHLAYETAVYLGANPIVLVGQDFAYGSDGITHSKQSKYAAEMQEHIEEIQALPVVYVEGNDGSQIPSVPGWVEFRKVLERMIGQNPQVTVINATAGGSKIKGTVRAKLTAVIETYCIGQLPYGLDSLMNDCKKSIDGSMKKHKLKSLELEMKKYIAIYRTLEKWTLQRRRINERLLEGLAQKTIAEAEQERRQVYEQNCREIGTFLNPPMHTVFFQQVILFGQHQINVLGLISSPSKIRKALHIQTIQFDHLNTICQSLVSHFQIAAEKMSSYLKE